MFVVHVTGCSQRCEYTSLSAVGPIFTSENLGSQIPSSSDRGCEEVADSVPSRYCNGVLDKDQVTHPPSPTTTLPRIRHRSHHKTQRTTNKPRCGPHTHASNDSQIKGSTTAKLPPTNEALKGFSNRAHLFSRAKPVAVASQRSTGSPPSEIEDGNFPIAVHLSSSDAT